MNDDKNDLDESIELITESCHLLNGINTNYDYEDKVEILRQICLNQNKAILYLLKKVLK